MRRTQYFSAILLGALGCLLAVQPAFAQCRAELAELDRLLESGELNERQVGIVEGMRQSAAYLCSAGQEAKVREMLESVDSILNAPGIGSPMPSVSGRSGKTRGKPDRADDRRAQTTARPAAVSPAASDNGQWVDRPEDMLQFWYRDIDRLRDKVRILYSTSPSLEQGRSGTWTANVYVVEITADGKPVQHRVDSRQSLDIVTAALRRGHNQVFAQRHVDGAQEPDRLELWSMPQGNVLSSVAIPAPRSRDGLRPSWSEFRTATFDGNVVFTAVAYEGGRSETPVSTAALMEVSPQGAIVGQAERRLENSKQQFRHWFPAHSGGAGAALDITRLDEQGLSDLIDSPIHREIAGRKMRAVVRSETRLALTDADTSSMALGPALERDLMWVGDMSIPGDLSASQQLAQNREQMLMMARTEIAAGARRHIRLIKPTADGYGMLLRVVGDRRIEPDSNGRHFVEVTAQGEKRSVFLKPAADELGVKFEQFAAADDGTVYLFGDGRSRSGRYDGVILPVLADGELGSAIPVAVPDSVAIDAMISHGSGVWLVGHGMSNTLGKVALWVGGVDPVQGQ